MEKITFEMKTVEMPLYDEEKIVYIAKQFGVTDKIVNFAWNSWTDLRKKLVCDMFDPSDVKKRKELIRVISRGFYGDITDTCPDRTGWISEQASNFKASDKKTTDDHIYAPQIFTFFFLQLYKTLIMPADSFVPFLEYFLELRKTVKVTKDENKLFSDMSPDTESFILGKERVQYLPNEKYEYHNLQLWNKNTGLYNDLDSNNNQIFPIPLMKPLTDFLKMGFVEEEKIKKAA